MATVPQWLFDVAAGAQKISDADYATIAATAA
jgi:hypothetical protein